VGALESLLQSLPGPVRSDTELQGQALLLLDWMKADPFDITPALMLTRWLNRYQSYHTARYLGENLRLIAAHHRSIIDTNIASTISLSILGSDGPVRALEFLDDYENRLTQMQQADLLRAWEDYDRHLSLIKLSREEAGDDSKQVSGVIPPPVPLDQVADIRVTLPIALDVIRLVCAHLSDNTTRMDALTAQLASQLAEREKQLRSTLQDTNQEHDEARVALNHLLKDRLWLRLWLTQPVDASAREKESALFGRIIEDDFIKLKSQQALTPQEESRFNGWMAYRNGKLDEARKMLIPLRHVDPQSAFCLALMDESENDLDAAVREFTQIHKSVPGSLLGLRAEMEMRRLRDRPIPVSAITHMLDELLLAELKELRKFASHPEQMLRLSLSIPDPPIRIPLYEPLSIRLAIHNDSTFDLAIGEGRTVDSSVYLDLFLIDNNDINISSKVIPLGSIVRSLERFTLKTGESTEVVFRPDRSVIGIPLREGREDTWYLHARVSLGERADGSASIATATRPLIMTSYEQGEPFDFVNSDDDAFLRVANLIGDSLTEEHEPMEQSVVDINGLREAWPHLSDEQRSYLLLTLPPSWKSNQYELLSHFEREIVLPTLGRLSKIIWIMTRVRRADDPILIEACRSEDQGVKDIAIFIRLLNPRSEDSSKAK